MILSEAQFLELRHDHKPRNGKRSTDYRWPDNTVIYQFESTHTPEEQYKIEMAMKQIEDATSSCIKFVERTNQNNYVAITVRTKCILINSLFLFQSIQ